MDRTMHRWYWIWEFAKEEAWLNKMASEGWALRKVGYGTYHFEPCRPGQYAVRLELLDNLPRCGGEYTDFLESTGAQYLGNVFRWAYFRKDTADGPFALFSDLLSRIRHLNRMIALMVPLICMTFFAGLANVVLRFTFNRCVGGFCLALAALLGYGLARILHVRAKLRREQRLHE